MDVPNPLDAIRRRFGGDTADAPPAPNKASAEQVARYARQWQATHGPIEADTGGGRDDPTMSLPFAKTEDADDRRVKHKAQFPWLYDPSRGVRWDFDPIELRNLAQENTWVGMLVQSITKEVAETPWTIVKSEDRAETRKRLTTHPEKRAPMAKANGQEYADVTAERIDDLLRDPNPDESWQDSAEQWMADLLEVGSTSVVKYFPDSAYANGRDDSDVLAVDSRSVRPRALQTSAPEVWTKDYSGTTGLLDGFWQFDQRKSPGSGKSGGGTSGTHGFRTPVFFDKDEIMWTDMTPRSNRRYGMPPTLLVDDFLQSLDLAINQEQQYLSRGSIPSGAWVFEEWDREEVKEWKTENAENVKGKPHKSLMFAGRGGDVRFEPMSMNFSELEFTERMKWYARVVASVFQVPTAVVGIEPEKVNYNTFQGERENFEENTLGPYLQKLERFVNDELIRPHWGSAYHFEFKPGISETTRQAMSERLRSEVQAGIRTPNEARTDLGMDEAMGEGADELGPVDGSSDPDTDPFGDVAMSATEPTAKDVFDINGTTVNISPPDYVVEAAEAADKAQNADLIPPGCGGEEARGEQRKREILNGEVGPDIVDEIATYLTSHAEDVTAEGAPNDWTKDEWSDCGNAQYAKWGGQGDGRSMEWAQQKSDEVAEARGETPTYKFVESVSGSGNASESVRKDEPLRGTDEWYQFDVQPAAIEALQDDIADDVAKLYDEVLASDDIQQTIERLAADDEGDEIGKSATTLARQLKEVLSQTRIAGDIADAIREHSAEAVRETLQETIEDADGNERPDPDAVDVEAVTSKLRDRDVGFANRFADQMAEDIRETVGDGWADGKNSFEIREDIADQADITEGWGGAERIARQELQIATGEARSDVAADLDKVEVWNDSGDDRVRPPHADMDGAWKRPGEEWEVDYSEVGRGVEKESVPGDSEPGIGCRCTTLLRDIDEVDDDNHAGV